MKPIKNIVFTETYIDRQGNEKKRYNKVGKLFYNEQYSSFSIKLDSIPIGDADNRFDGWLNTFDIDEDRQNGGNQRQQAPQQHQQPTPQQYAQPAQQQPQYAQPAAQPQQYAQQPPQAQYAQPAQPADNLPNPDDIDPNKPINLAEIPF